MLFVQLDFVTTRSRLLQRALSRLYAALAFFVGTSVSIGLVAITSSAFTLVPIILGLTGAGLLLYAAFFIDKGIALRARGRQRRDGFHVESAQGIRAARSCRERIKRARWFGGVK